MKLKMLLTSTLLVLVCPMFAMTYAATTKTITTETTTTVTTANTIETEGKILQWLIVLNKNEIAMSKEAVKHKLDSEVKKYAKLMIAQHNMNLSKTLKVSREIGVKPMDSAEATALKDKGQIEMRELKGLSAVEFQKKYMEAMVNGHAAALDTLKEDIAVVTNTTLKDHLETTAQHVEMHLEEAKAVQSKLDM